MLPKGIRRVDSVNQLFKVMAFYRKIIFILLVCIPFLLPAQKEANNWMFEHFQLDFNTPQVTFIPNNVTNTMSMGFTSISDSLGNLIMYTNSFSIWGKDYQLISNGDSLLPTGYHTYLQESVIVPVPGSRTQYYIFTVDPYNGFSWHGFYYCIVDMSLNGGHGKVTQKQVKLLDRVWNKIAAVYHSNHRDIWIIVQGYRSNNYYTYKITPAGVPSNPLVNTIGRIMDEDYGQLKVSPDSKTIAISMNEDDYRGVNLFDFNNTTGAMSNCRSFSPPVPPWDLCDGMEYSPDCRKIYLAMNYSYGSLYQFDITLPTGDDIAESAKDVLNTTLTDIVQLELGPDHRIYFTKGAGSVGGTLYIGIIEHPNIPGDSCGAEEFGMYLNGANVSDRRTPVFLREYFYKPTDFTFHPACLADSVLFKLFYVPGMDSVSWYFGDGLNSKLTQPLHKYAATGDYQAMSVAWYKGITDTTVHMVSINPSPIVSLGPDTTVCPGYLLSASNSGSEFLWNDGTTADHLLPGGTGTYWVRVTNQFGCEAADTVRIMLYPSADFSLGSDTVVCSNSGFILSPAPPQQGAGYQWSTGSAESFIRPVQSGLYWLRLTTAKGCVHTDSINLVINPSPAVNLGNDTVIGCSTVLTLDAGSYTFPVTYLWDDHSFRQLRTVNGEQLLKGANRFYVQVTGPDHCSGSDTIVITGRGPEDCKWKDAVVYPNPGTGIFFIRLPEIYSLRMELYSLPGQMISLTDLKGSDLYTVDYSMFPKGVYIMKLFYGGGFKKIVKLIIM